MRQSRPILTWSGWLFIALSAMLYAYAVWSAIGNVILFPQFADAIGLGMSAMGWFWLIAQVALPFLIMSAALVLGRKRNILVRGLILLVGVAVLSVLTIDIMHSIPQSRYFG
jgi:hypothetical protein